MDPHDAGAHSNAPRSNRFLRVDELAARGSRRQAPGHARGPTELFAEGQWRVIRVQLELEGWSLSQIEMLHEQLRQGWSLAHAKQNVAVLSGRCPLHSGLQP